MFLSINLFGQSNNDIYIQYLNEKNIEYKFDTSGNIMFNNYQIITNSGILGISENSNRDRNYFQVIRVGSIDSEINPVIYNKINLLINWINAQIVMGKVFLTKGENNENLLVFSSEVILNDSNDFVNYIDIMCNTIDIMTNLWENNLNKAYLLRS